MSKYFKDSEFRACVPSCRIKDMDAGFLSLLDRVREEVGGPLVLSCAYRSREYDLQKGRTGNSAHTRGLAVDIVCKDSNLRYRIVQACVKLGVQRIGIGATFVHIDADPSLPHPVLFHYY